MEIRKEVHDRSDGRRRPEGRHPRDGRFRTSSAPPIRASANRRPRSGRRLRARRDPRAASARERGLHARRAAEPVALARLGARAGSRRARARRRGARRAAPASAAARRLRRACPARRAAAAACACRSSSSTRRRRAASASSQVSCASRWTSYGRLPARSTMAAPKPASGGETRSAEAIVDERARRRRRESWRAASPGRPCRTAGAGRSSAPSGSARIRRRRSRPGAAAGRRRAAPVRRCRRRTRRWPGTRRAR